MISNRDAGAGHRLVAGARALYTDLSQELSKTIEKLKADYTAEESKGLAEALKAHRKALQTVLEFELSFLKVKEEAKTSNELDLDAARSEVISRFDRIASARSD